ncbi:MAG: sigma 54-interacting transcriptional regulator [Myxococcota bacterium]
MNDAILNLAADVRELSRLTVRYDEPDELLRRGLDWLARVAPYDLATVFLLEGEDVLQVRAAQGALANQVQDHHLQLKDFPTIRQALEERRARAFTEHDHRHGDGDPFDGVLDLEDGHSCMVAPMYTGERPMGVLALDREVCEPYPPGVVELVEVYAHLLAVALENAEQRRRLERLNARQREQLRLLAADCRDEGQDVLGGSKSVAVRRVAVKARQVAVTDTPVLILGETGTGKERLARAVHAWSRRSDGPFVALNCAAIPAGLVESELFGHKKGSFTGAGTARQGRFVVANGGTLLLDEIGELPLAVQAKLLRVLQEGTLTPVGADREVRVDVRILAATHVDLHRAVEAGAFREDLYYRLEVFPLRMPPLRERLDDLPALCRALLAEQTQRTGRSGLILSAAALRVLAEQRWPGNIRQLSNALERAVILAGPDVSVLGPELFQPWDDRSMATVEPASMTLEAVQRQHIERVLKQTGGRIYGEGGAAALLGMKPTTLQSRMKKLGVQRPD